MAIITPGPTVAAVSGSIGGTVFSRNRGGAYIRNRAVPTSSSSLAAVAAKGRLAAASQAWQALTEDQRLAWAAYSSQTPATNALGAKITLSGHQMYVRIHSRLDLSGTPPITDPPVAEPSAALLTLSLSLNIGAGDFTATFTATPLGATEHLWLKAAVIQSPGIKYINNLLKLLEVPAAATSSPYDFQEDLTDRFGTLQVGLNVAVEAYVFDNATGLLSARRRAQGPIVST